MNTNRIKQTFLELAKSVTEADNESVEMHQPREPQQITGSLLIRNGIVLRGAIAEMYMDALERMSSVIDDSDGAWSKPAVDDVISRHLRHVIEAAPEHRSAVIRSQFDQLIEELTRRPDKWRVDLSVTGMNADCEGLAFGKINFLVDTVNVPISMPGFLPAGSDAQVLFASIEVDAVDRNSATTRAVDLVEEHLAILNALCSDMQPSRFRLVHRAANVRRYSFVRTTKEGAPDAESRFHADNLGLTLLSRSEYRDFLRRRGGDRVRQLLCSRNAFGDRLLSGYSNAGAACVESRPQISFLLYAIALEGVVLGKTTKSELTFQLGARVAHLLASNISARRNVSKRVGQLYDLRSQIVHAGRTEIAETELEELRNICLTTLFALSISSAFKDVTTVSELEQWFNDRMLDAPPLS